MQAVKPALLYGAEVLGLVPFSKTWTQKIEKTQNKVARWILGVSKSTPASGLRAELGWRTVENEINEKKVAYWERLTRLSDDRWTKQAFVEILKGEYTCDWYSQVLRARGKIAATVTKECKTNLKSKLKQQWRKIENSEWKQEKERKHLLKAHPKDSIYDNENYVWIDSQHSRTLTKLRLGDYREKWGPGKGKCKGCGEDGIADMREHILLDCSEADQERQSGEVGRTIQECNRLQLSRQDTLTEILAGTSKDYRMDISKIVTTWEAANTTD